MASARAAIDQQIAAAVAANVAMVTGGKRLDLSSGHLAKVSVARVSRPGRSGIRVHISSRPVIISLR